MYATTVGGIDDNRLITFKDLQDIDFSESCDYEKKKCNILYYTPFDKNNSFIKNNQLIALKLSTKPIKIIDRALIYEW